MKTIALLFASNVFMTAAWYGHLRCAGFASLWLGERLRWNEAAAFALVLAAVVVVSLP